jgi:uncharacterized SAM-binding protein YcdF (DUF218 family)
MKPMRVTWRTIGWDGFLTLGLSLFFIALSAGLSWIWYLWRVYRTAVSTPAAVRSGPVVVVLGLRLDNEKIRPAYAARLERALSIFRSHDVDLIIIGGRIGTDRTSEAQEGERFLVARSVPPMRIQLEDSSQHTLENLRELRKILQRKQCCCFTLVTSRYHVTRCDAMARALGLQPMMCSAEDNLKHDARMLLRLAAEAFFLHWYDIGMRWSVLTANRMSFMRIT